MVKGKSDSAFGPLSVGAIVHYVLPHGARGEHRPAIVVLASVTGAVNLQVFTDAGDELPPVWHVADVKVNTSGAIGTCHLPEKG